MNRSNIIEIIKSGEPNLTMPQVKTLFYMVDKRAEQGVCEGREIASFYGWTDQMISKVLGKLVEKGLVVECGKRPRSVVKLYKLADEAPKVESEEAEHELA